VFFLKLTVTKLVMKLPTFYGTFITVSLLCSQEPAMNPVQTLTLNLLKLHTDNVLQLCLDLIPS